MRHRRRRNVEAHGAVLPPFYWCAMSTEVKLRANEWVMLDANDKAVKTPCCQSYVWLEPYLLTALCSCCGEPHDVATLGIVRGVR